MKTGAALSSVVAGKLQSDGLAMTYARWRLVGTDAEGAPVDLSGDGTIVSRRQPDGPDVSGASRNRSGDRAVDRSNLDGGGDRTCRPNRSEGAPSYSVRSG